MRRNDLRDRDRAEADDHAGPERDYDLLKQQIGDDEVLAEKMRPSTREGRLLSDGHYQCSN